MPRAPAPGFQKVTQAQLLRADRQAFVRISEQFTGSLKTFAGAGKPLDPLIERLEADMTVTYFMLPIPAGQGQGGSSTDKVDKDKKRPEAPGNTKGPTNQNKHQKRCIKGFKQGTQRAKREIRYRSL